MLILKENIGSGRHRRCYQHPFDSQKCVKTLYNPDDGGLKEVKRETRYYRKKIRLYSGMPGHSQLLR